MADPQVPLRVLHEAEHRLRRHIGCLQGIEDGKTHAVKAGQSACGTDPEVTVPGLQKRLNGIERQTLLGLPRVNLVLGE